MAYCVTNSLAYRLDSKGFILFSGLLMRSILRCLVGLPTASCSVYVPMQPHLPVIRAQGAGEFMLQTQPTIRPELTAAYSPLNHVLVLAAGSWRTPLSLGQGGKLDKFGVTQYELGAGTYRNFGSHWPGQATLGIGAAQVRRDVTETRLFLAFSSFYEARYRKSFGQLGLTHQQGRDCWGVGYRLTQVNFSELTASDKNGSASAGFYVLPLQQQWRHEPFAFVRLPLGKPTSKGHWLVQGSGALSLCLPGRGSLIQPFNDIKFRSQFNRGNLLLISAGITYRLTGTR